MNDNSAFLMSDDLCKVCVNPHCDAVWFFCSAFDRHCPDCDSRLININESTYKRKFEKNFLQYNIKTGEIYRKVTTGIVAEGVIA